MRGGRIDREKLVLSRRSSAALCRVFVSRAPGLRPFPRVSLGTALAHTRAAPRRPRSIARLHRRIDGHAGCRDVGTSGRRDVGTSGRASVGLFLSGCNRDGHTRPRGRRCELGACGVLFLRRNAAPPRVRVLNGIFRVVVLWPNTGVTAPSELESTCAMAHPPSHPAKRSRALDKAESIAPRGPWCSRRLPNRKKQTRRLSGAAKARPRPRCPLKSPTFSYQ